MEPTAEELEQWRLRSEPPDNEVPVAVPVSVVLARTDEAAVLLGGVLVHSTGVRFSIALLTRRDRPELYESFFGQAGEGVFLLGLQFADGRTVTTLDDGYGRPGPLLTSRGGGSETRRFDHDFWLAPVPPPGPLTAVVAWEAAGLPEASTVLDGDAIARAAGEAQVLWPREPPEEARPGRAVAQPPAGGWFARVLHERQGG